MCSTLNEDIQQKNKRSNWVLFEDNTESCNFPNVKHDSQPNHCDSYVDSAIFSSGAATKYHVLTTSRETLSYRISGTDDGQGMSKDFEIQRFRKLSREDSAFSELSYSSSGLSQLCNHDRLNSSSANTRHGSIDDPSIGGEIEGSDIETVMEPLSGYPRSSNGMGLSRRNQRLDSAFSESDEIQLTSAPDASQYTGLISKCNDHNMSETQLSDNSTHGDHLVYKEYYDQAIGDISSGLPQPEGELYSDMKAAFSSSTSLAEYGTVDSSHTSFSHSCFSYSADAMSIQPKGIGDSQMLPSKNNSFTPRNSGSHPLNEQQPKTPFDEVPGFGQAELKRKLSSRKSKRNNDSSRRVKRGNSEAITVERLDLSLDLKHGSTGDLMNGNVPVNGLIDTDSPMSPDRQHREGWICFDDSDVMHAESSSKQRKVNSLVEIQTDICDKNEGKGKYTDCNRNRVAEWIATEHTHSTNSPSSARTCVPASTASTVLSSSPDINESITGEISNLDRRHEEATIYAVNTNRNSTEIYHTNSVDFSSQLTDTGNTTSSPGQLDSSQQNVTMALDSCNNDNKNQTKIGNTKTSITRSKSFGPTEITRTDNTPGKASKMVARSRSFKGKENANGRLDQQEQFSTPPPNRTMNYQHSNSEKGTLSNRHSKLYPSFIRLDSYIPSFISDVHQDEVDCIKSIDSDPLDDYPPSPTNGQWSFWYKDCKRMKLLRRAEWVSVTVTVNAGTISVSEVHSNDVVLKEIPLLPFFAFNTPSLKDVERQNKLHVVKLQYVKYKETRKYGAKISIQHVPVFTSILKIGCKDCSYLRNFMDLVESRIRLIPIHRDKGISYACQEIFMNSDDICHFLLSGNGDILQYNITVRMQMQVFLSGAPQIQLYLNDNQYATVHPQKDSKCILSPEVNRWIKPLMVETHPCVDTDLSEKEGCIHFVPPDGCKFEIVRFRVHNFKELPILVNSSLDLASSNAIKIKAEVKAGCSGRLGKCICNNVEMRFPIPNEWMSIFRKSRDINGKRHYMSASANPASLTPGSCRGKRCAMKVSIGSVSVQPEFGAIIWRIGDLPFTHHMLAADATHTFSCHMELPFEIQLPQDFAPYAELEFNSPHALGSEVFVRDIVVTSGASADKWIQYNSRYSYKVLLKVLKYGRVIADDMQ